MNVQTMAVPPRLRDRISLDGPWTFSHEGGAWRSIPVPGPWQAAFDDLREASGVALYRRDFAVPQGWRGRQVAVRFGAVSYLAEVTVNGRLLGSHEGGDLPFEMVLPPDLLLADNRLEVRVTLPDGDTASYPDHPFAEIPHGKQSWYGPLGGLWQSVVLEARDRRHIKACRIRPDLSSGRVALNVDLSTRFWGVIEASISGPDGERVAAVDAATAGTRIDLEALVAGVRAWSPDQPNLYRLDVKLIADGICIDTWSEAFGFRTIEARDGRLWLNGTPIYLRGALDQDYYPEGICTPPSLGFLEMQLRKAKALGLNCLRCHIKVPDPRYYAVADRLGMLIWTEIPNVETFSARSAARLRATLDGILARDGNHPSIIIWTLINEDWGTRLREAPDQRAWLSETFDWLKTADPTRLVVDNSPCAPNFHLRTDINDYHYYRSLPERRDEWDAITNEFAAGADWTFEPSAVGRTGREPLIVSEFGAWGLPQPADLKGADGKDPWWLDRGTLWAEGAAGPRGIEARFHTFRLDRVFGSLSAFIDAAQWHQFATLKYQIESLRERPSIAGYVVTEFTDVHWEANGLMDLNRNDRVFHARLPEVNADIVVIAKLDRWAYWCGESLDIDCKVACGGRSLPAGCSIEWRLGDDGARGSLPVPEAGVLDVLGGMRLAVVLPDADHACMLDVHVRLVDGSGREIAANRVSVAVHPRRDHASTRPVLAAGTPDLAAYLSALGYPVVEAADADILVTTRLDAAGVERIRTGTRVLLLAGGRTGALRDDEPPREPPYRSIVDDKPGVPSASYFSFPGVGLAEREGTIWRGDWIGNFSWLKRQGPFATIPGGPMLDLTFDRVAPRAVITGHLRPWEFDGRVVGGVVVGWLHHPAATIYKKSFGAGHLVATTFRLMQDDPGRDPTAARLLDALIDLAGMS